MQNPEKISKSRLSGLENNPQITNKSQLNNSSSKMQYSMPKTNRWAENDKRNPNPHCYELPDLKSNRSASFGYGNKMDISKLIPNNPSPSQYLFQSQFQSSGKKKKGFSVGLGRQLVKAIATFDEKPFKIPGPGSYNVKDVQSKKTISFSGRHVDLADKYIHSVPGPGNYKTLELLQKNQRPQVSKYASVRGGRIDHSKRTSQVQQQTRLLKVPGPGQYQLEKKHEYIQRFPKRGGASFSKSQRKGIIQKSYTPGPGSYGSFSQFLH